MHETDIGKVQLVDGIIVEVMFKNHHEAMTDEHIKAIMEVAASIRGEAPYLLVQTGQNTLTPEANQQVITELMKYKKVAIVVHSLAQRIGGLPIAAEVPEEIFMMTADRDEALAWLKS